MRVPNSSNGILLALAALVFVHVQTEAYVLLGYRWPGSHPRVPFCVSTNLAGHAPYNGPLADGIRAITNAANTWNTQGASEFNFFYAGITEVTNVANDGINAVVYDPRPCPYPGTGCTAELVPHYGADQVLEGFDIVLYGSRSDGRQVYWTARDFVLGTEVDMESNLLHEFGHAVGLGHSSVQCVMQVGCGFGCRSHNLANDDISGIQAIYNPYSNEGLWATNTHPAPGETVTLFLDYPRSAGAQFQIIADFDGLSAGCPLRTLWGADSRIFPLDACPDPATGRWIRTPLERLVVPSNTGVLDTNGRAQVTVQIPASLSCFPTNRRWFFSAVVYNPALDPSGIEDVGVAVALDIQSPESPQLHIRHSTVATNQSEIRWQTQSNCTYQVEHSTTLTNWTMFGPSLPAPSGGAWLTSVVSSAQSSEFYRVLTVPPPASPCTGLLAIVVSTNYLRVPESSTVTLAVRLNQPPVGNVIVSLDWTTGDSSLTVQGSNSATFDATNWNIPQTFSIRAKPDGDSVNGTATFTLSGDGLYDVLVTAEEIDDDL